MARFIKIGIPLVMIFGISSFFLSSLLGEVNMEVQEVTPIGLTAQPYTGLAGSAAFREVMNQVSELHKSGKLTGTFCAYYQQNPDMVKDSILILVGAWSAEPPIAPDQNSWQTEGIRGGKTLTATVNVTDLFTPGPSEVNRRMEQYARENGLQLEPAILESYLPDGKIITQRLLAP